MYADDEFDLDDDQLTEVFGLAHEPHLPGRMLDLAKHCRRVRPDHPHRDVFASARPLRT